MELHLGRSLAWERLALRIPDLRFPCVGGPPNRPQYVVVLAPEPVIRGPSFRKLSFCVFVGLHAWDLRLSLGTAPTQ